MEISENLHLTMETVFGNRTATPVRAVPQEDLGLDSLLLLAVAAAAVLVGFFLVLLTAIARVRT